VEGSRQKSETLQGYGDIVLQAVALEEELAKARKHSAMLVSKHDGAFGQYLLTVKIRQPSHEFTFGVGMSFIPYPLVLTPVV
jgi:hypothetical protein